MAALSIQPRRRPAYLRPGVVTVITLFGATGYTGQRIAHTLAREGLPFRIAGRSAEKLRQLSAELPNHPEWLVADAQQTATLPPLFHNTRLLLNLAGPYTDLGERVIAQAAMSGVHYLDVTNELGYVLRARGYDEMARRTGAALVPACGFEVALSDCLAHRLWTDLMEQDPTGETVKDPPEPLDTIDVVYALHGKGASRGTRLSAVRSLATSWVAYRDGGWAGKIPGGEVRRFPIGAGSRYALLFPSAESVTLPAHLPVLRIDTWMSTTPGARFWAPLLVPLFARLSRSILRGLILKVAGSGASAEAPQQGLREDSPFNIRVVATQGAKSGWMEMEGHDPYGLTAEIAAYAARVMTAEGYAHAGMLAPAQAFDSKALIDYANNHWGLVVRQGNRSQA